MSQGFRIGSLVLALVFLAGLARAGGADERPNVVVLAWNDADLAKLSLTSEQGVTPNLAALVAQGAFFPHGTQVTTRGRATAVSTLTGRYPQRNGVYYQTGPKRLAAEQALSRVFTEAGYAALLVGKLREAPPDALGFQRGAEDVLGSGSGRIGEWMDEVAATKPMFVWWAPELGDAYSAVALDKALGELLALLEARGERANTLFAFFTNGEAKGSVFTAKECSQERMRNPLALVWPGHVSPGMRAEPVTPLDLAPTVLELAGVAAPAGLDGRSLVTLLPPLPVGGAWPERALFGTFFELAASQGSKAGREFQRDLVALTVRAGSFQYAFYLSDIGVKVDPKTELAMIERSAGDQTLFDLASDPREEHDLFTDPAQAERLATLRASVLAWWKETGAPDFPLPFLPPALGAPPKEKRPNIVLVIADDMDYEHCGFLGNPLAQTPTLDAIARAGCVFPVGYVPMSRCRPSLAALLSGRFPHQNGVYENEATHTLTRRDSLPNLLKAAGYATFQGGKFWEGSQLSMGFLEPKSVDTVFKNFVREDQKELEGFVDRYASERPMFVWWAPMLPHGPFNAPDKYRAPLAKLDVPLPEGLVGEAETFRETERTFYAMDAWFDDGLRELRDKLAAKGELEDTLFVFLIDNGYANGFVSKGSAYEKGLRTPVVFSWPGKLAGGRTSPALVQSVDLYATMLDFAGVPIPASAAGMSLRPTLEGKEQPLRKALYSAVYRYKERPGGAQPAKDVFALVARTERWKFVLYLRNVEEENYLFFHEFQPFPTRQRGERDLYDLAADPHERKDLSGDSSHAPLMDELLAGALAWWKETGGAELDLP
ncbi:MAG: sulfatase-like hydrolase/transferase [Planctomycetota bacterium]